MMDDALRERAEALNQLALLLAGGMYDAYRQVQMLANAQMVDEQVDIPPPTPEVVGAWCSTASISAGEVVFPRQYGGGGGKGGGHKGFAPGERKPYEEWTKPASEGQIKRLQIVVAKVFDHLKDPEKVRGFFQVAYQSRWEGELPDDYNHKDSTLTSGQASCLMDVAEEAFPGLIGEKGAKP